MTKNELHLLTMDNIHRLQEIFACVIRKEKYPMSQIDLFIEVLQSDGSEFACAINAATLALTEAGVELMHMACAASVGERLFARLLDWLAPSDICRAVNDLPPHVQRYTHSVKACVVDWFIGYKSK